MLLTLYYLKNQLKNDKIAGLWMDVHEINSSEEEIVTNMVIRMVSSIKLFPIMEGHLTKHSLLDTLIIVIWYIRD